MTAPVIEETPVETAQDEAALVDLMRSRAQTYGFLARLYRVEVDQPLLDEMRSMRFPTSTGNAHVDEGYSLI